MIMYCTNYVVLPLVYGANSIVKAAKFGAF